jgi:hypothetical protein
MNDTKMEQSIEAISLYHDLLSESDKDTLWAIANRALRKAVFANRAQIISSPLALVETKPEKDAA